jgi:hypothetical protein
MQDIVKKKAPVQATGGAGFRYENAVAARFLLDLLGGTNTLGVDFGRIARIDWQALDAGWYADDQLMCRVRLLHFDYEASPSMDVLRPGIGKQVLR